MKHGAVVQRHTRDCPREPDGSFATHRCKGTWRYVLEYGRDSNGTRMQTSKSGFATKAAAQDALQQMVRTLMTDINLTSLTIREYLETWLTSKQALKPQRWPCTQSSRPTTWCPTSGRSDYSSCARTIWTGCTSTSPSGCAADL